MATVKKGFSIKSPFILHSVAGQYWIETPKGIFSVTEASQSETGKLLQKLYNAAKAKGKA